MELKKYIKSELAYYNTELKIKKWMELCLIASVSFIFGGATIILLYLSNTLVLRDIGILIESIIIAVLGFILLVIYVWHYTILNPRKVK